MSTSTQVDLGVPRTVGQIVDVAAGLHIRRPVLFLTLAFSVIAPFTLIVVLVSGSSPLGESDASQRTIVILGIVAVALIQPMISVLQLQALTLIGEGAEPTLLAVYRRSLPVLAVAAAAQIVAGIAIVACFIAFVVPWVFLLVRFAVVAQGAAIQRTDWMGALRGSFELT